MNVRLIFTMKNRTLATELIEHSPTTTPCYINESGGLFLHIINQKCLLEM
jgi:hypothetical protein